MERSRKGSRKAVERSRTGSRKVTEGSEKAVERSRKGRGRSRKTVKRQWKGQGKAVERSRTGSEKAVERSRKGSEKSVERSRKGSGKVKERQSPRTRRRSRVESSEPAAVYRSPADSSQNARSALRVLKSLLESPRGSSLGGSTACWGLAGGAQPRARARRAVLT